MATVNVSASQAASGVLLAAGATASQTDLRLTDIAGRGVVFVLSTTTASGGNTVQVTFNGMTASGYIYSQSLLTGIAVAAVAVTPYRIGIGFTPSANAVANDAPPRTIQCVVTVVGTVAYGIDWFVVR